MVGCHISFLYAWLWLSNLKVISFMPKWLAWCTVVVCFFLRKKTPVTSFQKLFIQIRFFFSRCHCECHWMCWDNKYLAGKKTGYIANMTRNLKSVHWSYQQICRNWKRIGCRRIYKCAWKINVELSEVTTVINRIRSVCFFFLSLSLALSHSTLDGYLITWPRCTNKAALIIPAFDYMVE